MIRAIFFDAGNTLIHMDYAAIARRWPTRGRVSTARRPARRVARARAARRASSTAGTSTESPDSGERYLRYMLERWGSPTRPRWPRCRRGGAATTRPSVSGRKAIRDAEAALALARARRARGGVHLELQRHRAVASSRRSGLAPHLDFVLDSSEVGVEKPDRAHLRAGARAGGGAPRRGGLRRRPLLGGRARRARGRARRDPARSRRAAGARATAHARPASLAAVPRVLAGL